MSEMNNYAEQDQIGVVQTGNLVQPKTIYASKSCTGFFQKLQDKEMNIIIDNTKKSQMLNINNAMAQALQDQNKNGADFFVTKPQSLNEFFQAEEAIQNVLNNDSKKNEMLDELGSIFDDDRISDQEIDPQYLQRDGQKMKEDLTKAQKLLNNGMDQVRQLKRMVSETKQSLQDQKRLQYLENIYRDKIRQDEEMMQQQQDAQSQLGQQKNLNNKLSFVDKKRRLQSAFRPNGAVGIGQFQKHLNCNSGLSIGVQGYPQSSYADQIAQKYKDRGMSAQARGGIRSNIYNRMTQNNGQAQSTNYMLGSQPQIIEAKQRRRTAQPNQRQKMIEKIRDVKQKEEERLRETLMNFYKKQQNEETKNEEDQPYNFVRQSQENKQFSKKSGTGLMSMIKQNSESGEEQQDPPELEQQLNLNICKDFLHSNEEFGSELNYIQEDDADELYQEPMSPKEPQIIESVAEQEQEQPPVQQPPKGEIINIGSLKDNLELLNQARKLAQMGLSSHEKQSNILKANNNENVSLNLNFNFNFNLCNENQQENQNVVESAPMKMEQQEQSLHEAINIQRSKIEIFNESKQKNVRKRVGIFKRRQQERDKQRGNKIIDINNLGSIIGRHNNHSNLTSKEPTKKPQSGASAAVPRTTKAIRATHANLMHYQNNPGSPISSYDLPDKHSQKLISYNKFKKVDANKQTTTMSSQRPSAVQINTNNFHSYNSIGTLKSNDALRKEGYDSRFSQVFQNLAKENPAINNMLSDQYRSTGNVTKITKQIFQQRPKTGFQGGPSSNAPDNKRSIALFRKHSSLKQMTNKVVRNSKSATRQMSRPQTSNVGNQIQNTTFYMNSRNDRSKIAWNGSHKVGGSSLTTQAKVTVPTQGVDFKIVGVNHKFHQQAKNESQQTFLNFKTYYKNQSK